MFFLQRIPEAPGSSVPDNEGKCTCSHWYNFHRKEDNRHQPSSSSSSSSLNFDSSNFQQPLSWLNSSQSTSQLPIPGPPAKLLAGANGTSQHSPHSLVSSSISSVSSLVSPSVASSVPTDTDTVARARASALAEIRRVATRMPPSAYFASSSSSVRLGSRNMADKCHGGRPARSSKTPKPVYSVDVTYLRIRPKGPMVHPKSTHVARMVSRCMHQVNVSFYETGAEHIRNQIETAFKHLPEHRQKEWTFWRKPKNSRTMIPQLQPPDLTALKLCCTTHKNLYISPTSKAGRISWEELLSFPNFISEDYFDKYEEIRN